ncbi:hypothetical protein ANS017_17240 [Paraclostridium bifermentans]|uniref:hypothetical protein n=1 Tax=Paraclostridium bifermentans TaxID=1490 RepID=UPI0021C4C36D|nr:hypothetical protein [Paraclostridium bifermentans]GKZ03063.1 hypothetical protein ANS014_14970 [Paraclostridium bifermentans]GKZ07318.1 hypothetical protein ANS015_22010 [Paraclostridium bifermentans]GKZ10340.1 hypothetical protein ANS017_17240 [Paraclostridium bifermentans]
MMDITIKKTWHYEIQLGSKNDRGLLLTLKDKKHTNFIGNGINIIYIYQLVDSDIHYPNGKGKIIYIGEACKFKNPTGLRFSQHISSNANSGKNRNGNYTLNKYYWSGEKIAIDILDIGDVESEERKKIEKMFIDCHIKIYGSTPIAQGSSGKLITYINNLDTSDIIEFFDN